MKQKRAFCKRLLTALLSVAMVFTSINMPGNVMAVKAAENAYEGTDTCGATYNEDTKEVTFFIKSTDAAFASLNNFFYKEYSSYEDAAAAHISNNGNFIDGLESSFGKLTESADGGKEYKTAVSEGTGAILYYFSAEGIGRPEYERIIVIENGTGGSDPLPTPGEGNDPVPGEGDEGGDTVSGNYINFEEIEHSDDINTEGVDVQVTYAGTTTTVTGKDWGNDWGGDSKYQIQLKNLIPVTTGKTYEISFKITSEVARNVLVKLGDVENNGTVYLEETFPLEAGKEYTYTKKTTKPVDIEKLMVLFALGDQTADTQNTITIKDMSLTEAEADPEPTPTPEVTPKYINFEAVGHNDVIDAGTDVEVTYAGTTATATGKDWGNDWGGDSKWQIQLKNLIPVTSGENYKVSFKITSEVARTVFLKLGDVNSDGTVFLEDTITLEAGVPYEYTKDTTKEVSIDELMVLYALGDQTSDTQNTIKIENLSLYGEKSGYVVVKEAPTYINFEAVGHNDVIDAGTDVEVTYAGTIATATGKDWGNDWGGDSKWQIQLKNLIPVASGENYKVSFKITSEVARTVFLKLGDVNSDGTVFLEDTITLEAGVPYEYTKDTTKEVSIDELMVLYALGDQTSDTQNTIKIENLSLYGEKSGYVKILAPQKEAPAIATDRISKSNGYVVGNDVVLNFTDDEEWRSAITAVKVANKTLDAEKYTVKAGKLTIDASAFTKQNIYAIEVEADGYATTSFTLPVYNASIDSEVWVEEWRDDFDKGELDLTKWDYEIGVKSGDDNNSSAPIYWGNEEKQFYTKEAVSFDDDNLIITATALTDELRAKYNITDQAVKYSSARLRTVSEDGQNTLYGTTYGKIEARMALPTESGYWPAFWMLPTNETIDLYGGWPSSGEIDIMEAGQNVDLNKIDGTLHYGSFSGHVYKGNSYYLEESEGDFHTYAIEWEPGEIRWYVDGILYNIQNNWYGKEDGASDSYSYPAPFDEDFYILLNLAMEGQYVSHAVPTVLGQSMKVDYVEVSKLEGFDYGKEAEKPGAADKDTEFFDKYAYLVGEDGNLLQDPNFDTLPDNQVGDGGIFGGGEKELEYGIWFTSGNTGSGASATRTVEEIEGKKWAKVDVHTKGANVYDVQIFQHVPIAQGYSYKLTFDAFADKDGRTVAFSPSQGGDNGWGSYGASEPYTLNKEVQSYEYVFTMSDASDATTRMEMNVGHDTGAVYFSNFKLVAMTDKELEDYENEQSSGNKTPLADGNHVYNGSFNQGTNGLGYWDLAGDVTVDNANRSANITINSSSSMDDASLTQTGLQLLKGEKYKVTLDAKVAENKDIKVGLYSADGSVTYGETVKTVTAEDGAVALEFTMPKDVDDTAAVIIIAFGGNTIAVEIDNVSMVKTTNNNAEWTAAVLYPLGTSESWSEYSDYQYGAVATKKVPADGVVTEELASDAKDNWQHQLFADANVLAGYTYELSYDIKTSVAGQKVVSTVQQDQTWADFGTTRTIETTTDWQQVNVVFTPTSEGNIDLKFLLSTTGNDPTATVSIANVKMTVVDGPYVTVTNIPEEAVKVGTKLHLNATHTASVGSQYEVYTFASSNEAVATVTDGIVEALTAGTTTITVTSATGTKTSFTLTVVADGEAVANADTTGLAAKVKEYETVKADTYTTASYADFTAALTAANKILADVTAGIVYSQDAVDAAVADLEEAYNALVKKATAEQITAVAKAVEDANGYVTKKADYTTKSYAEFEKAYNAVVAINTDIATGDCSEEAVAKALAKLEAAIAGLELKAVEMDVTALETAVNNAAVYVEQSHLYTDSSYKAFAVAYDKAVAILDSAKAGTEYSAEAITGAANALNEAAAALVAKEGLWFEPIEDQTYTGSALKPVVVVWDGGRQLEAGKDYKVSYSKNTNVGKATVTVTGKGNYNKKATTTFNIVAKDLGDEDIIAADVMATIDSKGKVKNPKVIVKHGKKTLGSKDITIKYPTRLNPNNAKEGDYTITIVAKEGGNYTGSTTVNYEVRKETVMMSKVKVVLSKQKVTYAGEDTETPLVTVTYGSGTKMVPLTENEDYTVEYNNFDLVGTNKASVTVTATEDSRYYGSKTVKYTVEGRTLSNSTVTVSGIDASYPFTGELVEIAEFDEDIKLIDKKNKVTNAETGAEEAYVLVKDTDYEVTYDKNLNAGKKAVMIITGKGLYAGTIKKNFTISPLDLKTANAENSAIKFTSDESAVYNKNGAELGYSLTYMGEDLTSADYKVTYKNNKKVGDKTALMTITGKGNFTGKLEVKYTVLAADITDEVNNTVISMDAQDAFINKNTKADKLKTTVKLVEEETGKVLKAGTDYDKAIVYFVKDATAENGERKVEQTDVVVENTIWARVTLTGNYKGVLEVPFRLYDKNVSSLTVAKIAKQIYTGDEIEPDVHVYTDKKMQNELPAEGNFIVSYDKNINKGTAKATITGVGNGYGGTKTVTFKIDADEMKWSEQAIAGITEFISNLFK